MENQNSFQRPDPEKVDRAIRYYHADPVGIVLRLAWRAGLSRGEIHALTWYQVHPAEGLLRLPDRDVPLEPELVRALEEWRDRCGKYSSYVAYSPRSKRHMAPQSMSTLVKSALESMGLEGVSLRELRLDYMLRTAQEHGVTHMLRVAGVPLSTYNRSLAALFRANGVEHGARRDDEKNARASAAPGEAERSYRLWQIMQREKHSPGGLALWLTRQLGLSIADITTLTWADVDLDAGVLRAGAREYPLTRSVQTILKEELALRRPEDDPHLVLSPESRRALTSDRLSVLVREALIRGGIGDLSAVDLRREFETEHQWRQVRAWLDSHGSITPGQAAELLSVSAPAAWNRLQSMERLGHLAHIGHKYYPADKTPSPERLRAELLDYISRKGSISCAEAEARFGIPSRQIGYYLRSMVKRGELDMVKRGHYALPAPAGDKEGRL